MKNIAIVMAVLLLCFPAYAQDEVEVTNAGVTPDSMLWSVDRTAESASLLFTFDEQTRAEKRLRYAQERLDEAKVMIAAQDIDAAQKAQKAHARSLAAVRRDVSTLAADDATEELQKKTELQRTIESQQEQVIQIQNKIEIRVRGQLTPEQKEKLDALLQSFSEETATAHENLAAEEEKAKLKVKAMGGTTEVEMETSEEMRPLPETARQVPPRPINPLFSSAKFSCDDGTSVTETTTVQEGQKPICRDYAAWKATGVKHCASKDTQLIDIEMGTQCNAVPPNGDVLATLNTPFELKVGQQARLENMGVIAFYQESVKQSCATPIVKCPQYSPPAPGWCAEGKVAPGSIDENGCRGPPRCIASSTQPEEEQVATAKTTLPTEQQPVPMPTRQEPISLPNRRCGEVAVVVLSAIGKKDIAKLRVGEALEVGTFSLRYLVAYPERNAALFELQMGYGDDALPVPMPKPAPEPMPVPTMPVGFHAATVTCSDGVKRTDTATSCMRLETWKDAAVELCTRNGASLSDLQFDKPCDLQGTTSGTRGKPIAEEVAVKSATVR